MAVVDLRPALRGDLGFRLALAVVQQRLVADLLERAGNAAVLVVPAAVPVRIAGEPLLQRREATETAGRARRGDGSGDASHESREGCGPLERLEAAHRWADHGDKAFQSERIDQQLLAGHHVTQRDLGERRAVGFPRLRIDRVRARAAVRGAECVHRHDEELVGVDRLARSDQPVEPAGGTLGHTAPLFARRVLAGGVMARGVAVHDQNTVVFRCIQCAVGFVGKLDHGQRLPIFQPEIVRREEFALDSGQFGHGIAPFGG